MRNLIATLKRTIPENFVLRVLWHRFEGFFWSMLYGFPSWKLRVIGITGSDGKTTTSQMVVSIFRAAGRRVGLSSTTHFQVGDERWANQTHQTTLGRYHLSRLLRRMLRERCDTAVLEVTSHALHQGRVGGVAFDCACITTISHEHLDYHKTLENYIAAKKILFTKLASSHRKKNIPKVAVVNLDIPQWHEFAQVKADEVYGYTTDPAKKAKVTELVWASDIHADRAGTKFTLHLQHSSVAVHLPIIGIFNVSNALAAAAVCYSQGVSLDVIKHALDKFHFNEGRMQRVDSARDFDVYVDFANTPGALENVYKSLRAIMPGRIIAVLGAAGHRDRTKWPEQGEVAVTLADMVVVTDDEPYTDDPAMLRGLLTERFSSLGKIKDKDYVVIPDRREAIAYALRAAKKGDVVIITGMGSYEYRMIGMEKVPWSDVQVVKEELNKLG